MEERFEIFIEIYEARGDNDMIVEFVKSEQSGLLREVLARKVDVYPHDSMDFTEYIAVEDVRSIAEDMGIDVE